MKIIVLNDDCFCTQTRYASMRKPLSISLFLEADFIRIDGENVIFSDTCRLLYAFAKKLVLELREHDGVLVRMRARELSGLVREDPPDTVVGGRSMLMNLWPGPPALRSGVRAVTRSALELSADVAAKIPVQVCVSRLSVSRIVW